MPSTPRTTLTLIQQSDFPEALEMFAEPDTFEYIKPLQNKTDEEYTAFLNLKAEQSKSGSGYYWIIRHSDTNKMIGAINLTPIPNTDMMQLGWQIKTAFRKQGYATEAAAAALEFAKTNTTINPIYAVFIKENIASQRILEHLGFQHHDTKQNNGQQLLRYIHQAPI